MRKVLELPAFRRLLVASIFNELAFSIGSVALALLIYRRTGSAIGAMAFFLCAEFGPAFISPLFVTRLDQRAVRGVLVALYAIEGLIFVALAALVHHFALAAVLALVLVDGALAVTARVLSRAAWTSLTAPAGLLREANAMINTSFATAFMLGPAIGGAVVALGGTVAALLVNAGLFGLIVLSIGTSRGLPLAVPDPVPTAGRLRAAVSRVRTEPLLRRLFVLQSAGMLFFTVSIPVEVVFARHALHTGPSGYGFLLAAWGAGGIAGSGVYARWRRLPNRHLMTLGTGALGVGFVVMAVAPTLAVALVGSALAGVGNGIQIVAFRTALQEETPELLMALILSLNESMFQAIPGAGILLGGVIAALAGPRIALAAGAAGSLLIAVAMWLGLRSPPVSESTGDIAGKDADELGEDLTLVARRP